MAVWKYLVVEVSNQGRTITENGIVVKSHTRKKEMTALPRNMWNIKGKKMKIAAKGEILDNYGSEGWELISIFFGDEETDNRYYFKQNN